MVLSCLLGIAIAIVLYMLFTRLRAYGAKTLKTRHSQFQILAIVLLICTSFFLPKPELKEVRKRVSISGANVNETEKPITKRLRMTIPASNSASTLINPLNRNQLISAILTLVILWLIRTSVFQRYLISQPAAVASSKALPIQVSDAKVLIERLNELFEEHHIYKDNNLDLNGLSNRLDISRYHLSLILNKYCGKNFYELVNNHRVEASIKMLDDRSHDHMNLLSIGYEVGFNSKASFYRAFKQKTGTTPKAYRDSVKDC